MPGSRIVCALVCLLVPACGSDPGPDPEAGRELYDGPASAALGDPGNQARCATCHAADDLPDGFAGDSLQDVAFRASFKGGEAADLRAATNACVTGWMGGAALTAGDPRWLELEAFLVSISSPSVTSPRALAPEVLADEAAYGAAYGGGMAFAGTASYGTFCIRCHDGKLRVGAIEAPALATLKTLTIGRIAQQVRTSGPPPSGTADASDSTPGPMPFFEPDELSPQDLANIIAFIRQ